MLYMFRTVLVHHQEQLYELYIAFGICRYHTSGCCVAIATILCILLVHIHITVLVTTKRLIIGHALIQHFYYKVLTM